MITVPMLGGTRSRYEVTGRFGASRVLLKPASPGTGVIAAGGVRAILTEAAGVQEHPDQAAGVSNNPQQRGQGRRWTV